MFIFLPVARAAELCPLLHTYHTTQRRKQLVENSFRNCLSGEPLNLVTAFLYQPLFEPLRTLKLGIHYSCAVSFIGFVYFLLFSLFTNV